ncbi:hypothetical protein MMC16_007051 [Acarospora aff. strigata]|nr:hypothetical protein [Acarospora aff. strigata]
MASHPQAGYPYCTLQPGVIRLLRIYPGAVVNDLFCDLEEVHITQVPAYEALSYCWGDESDRLPVNCNGAWTLGITRNLHAALIRLRLPNQSRLVWADAICINQGDLEERSCQVRMMKDIYQRAFSVVIWLGGPIEVHGTDTWPIPPLLEAAQKNLKRDNLPIRNGLRNWERRIFGNEWSLSGDLGDKKWYVIIKSLILLLHRPWFLRTWIIQEVALATSAVVLCGDHAASWEDFYRAVSYAIDLEYFSNTTPETYSSVRHIEKSRWNLAQDQNQSPLPRPLDLLVSFRTFLATDARDKVFGLYSLFNPSDLAILELQPDYKLELVDVYTRAAIDCIATEGTLDILSFGGQDCLVADRKLPTWVPDWQYQDRTMPLLPRFLSFFSLGDHQWNPTWKSATGNSYPIVELSEHRKVIKLSGYVLDRVAKTGGVLEKAYYESLPGHPMIEVQTLVQNSINVFEKWEALCGVVDKRPHHTKELGWDVYWKSMYAGCYPYGSEQQTRAAFEKWYQPFNDVITFTESCANVDHISTGDSSMVSKIVAGVGWFAKTTYQGTKFGIHVLQDRNKRPQTKIFAFDRTMIKTEDGYVGITSRHVKEGDAVALFQGGKMPLIIREAEGEGTWQLVGDAYLHGIMNGEVFDPLRCDTICLI